jgi:uncharacterized protein (TIGR02722 family)
MMANNYILNKTALVLVVFLAGCATGPQYVDATLNKGNQAVTMGIDRQDFESVAQNMVDSLLSGNALNKKGGGRYVVMISNVINDTTQRVDPKILTKKIRIAMLKSGKAVITSAVGTERDDLAQQVRVDKKTIQPHLSLSGYFLQKISETSRGEQVVDYYFQLTLTDIRTGLVIWEDEAPVSKLGTNDTVTW